MGRRPWMATGWWRLEGDSLRVDAADIFNGVWLRLQLQDGGVVGRATIQTDAGSGSTTTWRATWAACPGSASRPPT